MSRGYYQGDPFFILKAVKTYKCNLKWSESNRAFGKQDWCLINCKFGIGKEVSPYAYCLIKNGDQTIYRSSILNKLPGYDGLSGEKLYTFNEPNVQLKGVALDAGIYITVLSYNPQIFYLDTFKEYSIEIYSLSF